MTTQLYWVKLKKICPSKLDTHPSSIERVICPLHHNAFLYKYTLSIFVQQENRHSSEDNQGREVVGTTTEQLEPSQSGVLNTIKHDINRILAQHSYAQSYPITDTEKEDNDKGDMFYASYEANDCITVEVPSEEQVEIQTESEVQTDIETEFNILTDNSEVTLECDMKLLSPMSLSPKSVEENLLGVSPSHTNFSSDLGYESLSSPFSEQESMDLSDFWCDSLSELFPGLA